MTHRIENILIKNLSVLICCCRWVSDGWIKEEKHCCTKIMVFLALCSTMYVQLDFHENVFFLESVYFHCEMFSLLNFLLVLRVCIINVMILNKKYVVNWFRMSILKKRNKSPVTFEMNARHDVFGFLINKFV